VCEEPAIWHSLIIDCHGDVVICVKDESASNHITTAQQSEAAVRLNENLLVVICKGSEVGKVSFYVAHLGITPSGGSHANAMQCVEMLLTPRTLVADDE
jgi:hypothetical protein